MSVSYSLKITTTITHLNFINKVTGSVTMVSLISSTSGIKVSSTLQAV